MNMFVSPRIVSKPTYAGNPKLTPPCTLVPILLALYERRYYCYYYYYYCDQYKKLMSPSNRVILEYILCLVP